MSNPNYDALDGWREEVGIKNSKGEVKHYAGGCEYDPMVEAIREYEREQAELARRAQDSAKNTPKDLDQGR